MNRFALACCATLPVAAGAAQWQAIPQFSLGVDADSNRRLLQDPKESESAVLGGTMLLARVTEISKFAFVPRATVSRYSGEDAMDSEDYGASVFYRRNGERVVLDLSGGYANDSTLTTELGETGLVEGNTRRTAINVGGSLSQYISTRHLLRYQVSAADIDYERTAGTGLVGYRYPGAGITYVFSATQRLETTLGVTAARLEAPDVHVKNETRGAQLGMTYRVSERLSFVASVGRSTTESRGVSDTQQSYSAGVTYSSTLSSLEVTVSRDVEPSGRGVLVNADDVRIAYSRRLGERLSLDGSLRTSRRQDLSVNSALGDYEYDAAALILKYQLGESWSVSLAGVYSRQDHEFALEDADGTRIGLAFNWQPLHE